MRMQIGTFIFFIWSLYTTGWTDEAEHLHWTEHCCILTSSYDSALCCCSDLLRFLIQNISNETVCIFYLSPARGWAEWNASLGSSWFWHWSCFCRRLQCVDCGFSFLSSSSLFNTIMSAINRHEAFAELGFLEWTTDVGSLQCSTRPRFIRHLNLYAILLKNRDLTVTCRPRRELKKYQETSHKCGETLLNFNRHPRNLQKATIILTLTYFIPDVLLYNS